MPKQSKKDSGPPAAVRNRKAYFEYEILEKIEAGMVLQGSEVKSLRSGQASLEEAFAVIDPNEEVFLLQLHIKEYPQATVGNHEPTRKRKLLLHKAEIRKMKGKLSEKGHTLIPLAIYFKGSRAKVELGIARGKKRYDKRQSIKKKEAKREIDRAMSRRR